MDTGNQMVYACKTGDLELLKTLIGNGGDIHMIITDNDNNKSNLLSVASMNNKINMVEFLIDNKVDITMDFPMLSIVCNCDYFELFYFLINKIPNIDVNAKNIYGKTSIFYTTNLKIIKTLLDLGANPYHKDREGNLFYYNLLSEFEEKEIFEYIDTLNFDVKPAKGS
jgi:ankyrin repeat protein